MNCAGVVAKMKEILLKCEGSPEYYLKGKPDPKKVGRTNSDELEATPLGPMPKEIRQRLTKIAPEHKGPTAGRSAMPQGSRNLAKHQNGIRDSIDTTMTGGMHSVQSEIIFEDGQPASASCSPTSQNEAFFQEANHVTETLNGSDARNQDIEQLSAKREIEVQDTTEVRHPADHLIVFSAEGTSCSGADKNAGALHDSNVPYIV